MKKFKIEIEMEMDGDSFEDVFEAKMNLAAIMTRVVGEIMLDDTDPFGVGNRWALRDFHQNLVGFAEVVEEED